ncbi:MAG: hypothetical protein K2P58_12330 [Hyphomonadaceae bacterium]|nr:hypothetical protein [Hyphomonadaceae bacterium]
MPRRPNIRSAGVDLALAAAALIAGLAGVPASYAAAGFALAVAIWAATRWGALARMEPMQRLTNTAVALAMLAVVLGGAYWFGLMVGGHT